MDWALAQWRNSFLLQFDIIGRHLLSGGNIESRCLNTPLHLMARLAQRFVFCNRQGILRISFVPRPVSPYAGPDWNRSHESAGCPWSPWLFPRRASCIAGLLPHFPESKRRGHNHYRFRLFSSRAADFHLPTTQLYGQLHMLCPYRTTVPLCISHQMRSKQQGLLPYYHCSRQAV